MKPLNGAVGSAMPTLYNLKKRRGREKTPLKDGEEKELTIAAVGLACPINAPAVIWAKFLSLSIK